MSERERESKREKGSKFWFHMECECERERERVSFCVVERKSERKGEKEEKDYDLPIRYPRFKGRERVVNNGFSE